MTFQALSAQYLTAAHRLKTRTHQLLQQKKTAPLQELAKLDDRIALLRTEYYDLRHHAAHLKKYGDLYE